MKVWALVQYGEGFAGDGDVRAVVAEESVAHDWEARGAVNRAIAFELNVLPKDFRRSAISGGKAAAQDDSKQLVHFECCFDCRFERGRLILKRVLRTGLRQ